MPPAPHNLLDRTAMTLLRMFFITFVRLLLLFASRPRYEEKVAAILSPEAKNKALVLNGWTYETRPSVDGTRVHRFYHHPSKLPAAPYLLLLHGMNLDGRTYLGFKSLADRFNLISYDFPEDASWYSGTMDDFTLLFEDFLRVMHIDSFHIAGTSFGGIVAQHLSHHFGPSRVLSLSLISTAVQGHRPNTKEQGLRMAHLVQELADWQIACVITVATGRFMAGADPQTRSILEPVMRLKGIAYYRQLTATLRGYDGKNLIQSLRMPVLVVHGLSDTVIPIIALRIFRKLLRTQAEFIIIPAAGHAMVFSHAAQVSALVGDFCSRHASKTISNGVAS